MDKKSSKSLLEILSISLFAIFLTALIAISFFKNQVPYDFSAGMITVILIIVVLILSGGFDNIQIGTILSLKRQVNQKSNELESAKDENQVLRENIIKLSSTMIQKQNQSVTNVNGINLNELAQFLGVRESKSAEANIEKEFENESNLQNEKCFTSKAEVTGEKSKARAVQFMKFIESEAIERYIEDSGYSVSDLTMNVEFTPLIADLDPIMDKNTRFDAYLKSFNREYFIEVRMIMRNNFSMLYTIYMKLSQILIYRNTKHVSAKMLLLVPIIEENEFIESGRFDADSFERLIRYFSPAIKNDLLEVKKIIFSETDALRWIEKQGKAVIE